VKSNLLFFLACLAFLPFTSCEKLNPDIVCFGFDQRQCGMDEWADLVPISDDVSVRESKMKEYLESKDLAIREVKLVKDFYGGVCKACGVCPEPDRFIIRINIADTSAIKKFDFLGNKLEDCSEYF